MEDPNKIESDSDARELERNLSERIERGEEGSADFVHTSNRPGAGKALLAHATDTPLHSKTGRLARSLFCAAFFGATWGGIGAIVTLAISRTLPAVLIGFGVIGAAAFVIGFVIFWRADV